MSSRPRDDTRRYRRRILTIGAVALGLTFVIGAPFYVDGVESDLEQRVPDELADAGFDGISATFDGQDGTLSCTRPLADPESARQAAYDVWGVRAIELDRSCRVNAEPGDDTTDADAPDDASDDDASDDTTPPDTTDDGDESADTTVPSPTTTEPEVAPAFDTVQAALSGSPQLSLFAVLSQEADLATEFGDPTADPVTVFAPTDEAFEALPADVLADLRADPDALRDVLLHHTADGPPAARRLRDGPARDARRRLARPRRRRAVDRRRTDLGRRRRGEYRGGAHHRLGARPRRPRSLRVTDGGVGLGVVRHRHGRVDRRRVDRSGAGHAPHGRQGTGGGGRRPDDRRPRLRSRRGDGRRPRGPDRRDAHPPAQRHGRVRRTVAVPHRHLRLRDGARRRDGGGRVGRCRGRTRRTSEATDDDAVDLEAELNEFVADNPILFEPGSAIISQESLEVLGQLAQLAQQFDGVSITVEGHTDSDGSDQQNQTLSEARAYAVQLALIERGVPAASVQFEGFGSSEPILVDGVEDKEASRRVEFSVEATS